MTSLRAIYGDIMPPVTELEHLQLSWQLTGVPRSVILLRQKHGEQRRTRESWERASIIAYNWWHGVTAAEAVVVIFGAASAWMLLSALSCDVTGVPTGYCRALDGATRGVGAALQGWVSLALRLGVLGIVSNAVSSWAYGARAEDGGGGCPVGFGGGAGRTGPRSAGGASGDLVSSRLARGKGFQVEASSEDKVGALWSFVRDGSLGDSFEVEFPAASDVAAQVFGGDYSALLTFSGDTREDTKLLCHAGATALCEVQWFPGHAYTGLFRGDSVEGLVRLSTAMAPVTGLPAFSGQIAQSKLFPCAAIKLPRGGRASGNLLFGGKKTGQPEPNFFARAQCTHMTEKVNFFLRPVLERFRRYSAYPTQLGLSDFASFAQDGAPEESGAVEFPWCLVLMPSAAVRSIGQAVCDEEPDALLNAQHFLRQIMRVPEGTDLYDVYACPDPDAAMAHADSPRREGNRRRSEIADARMPLLRIGRVRSRSAFVHSAREQQLFFKHQRKEEDYELKPEWRGQIQPRHQTFGSDEFQRRIDRGLFVDLAAFQEDSRAATTAPAAAGAEEAADAAGAEEAEAEAEAEEAEAEELETSS